LRKEKYGFYPGSRASLGGSGMDNASGARQLDGPVRSRHTRWPLTRVCERFPSELQDAFRRKLDPPADGHLQVFSIRLREEVTATNSVVTLVQTITTGLTGHSDALDDFDTRLMQAGYSPAEADRYDELRFRVINERLYDVAEGFPRLSAANFVNGLPSGIERVEYEVNLEGCPDLIVASSPADFAPPPTAPAARMWPDAQSVPFAY
jgi:hypothetical protein